MKILVYGYGNPGRRDDGMGTEFVARLESLVNDNEEVSWNFDSNYQLNIEDADAVAKHDVVIFADATVEEVGDYCFSIVDGKRDVSFTSHSASPGYIVYLCEKLFGKNPVVYLLHIKGHEWDFREGLSDEGEMNLSSAVKFMAPFLKEPKKLFDIENFKTKLCRENG